VNAKQTPNQDNDPHVKSKYLRNALDGDRTRRGADWRLDGLGEQASGPSLNLGAGMNMAIKPAKITPS
jgi:hypothetical protein